jgi:YHS domain-containing protein
MTDLATFLHRIDEEVKTEVERQKAAWEAVARENRERGPRLERYEAIAQHLIELLKPRLNAFLERFKDVVKAEPTVREHTRAMSVEFCSTLAKVTLRFEIFPDEDVSHVRLECTQEIIPILFRYDRQSVLEFPLDAVQDNAAVQWFDERVVSLVKAYMTLMRQDKELKERLKDQLVEDPLTKIRFPKYLAASTLQRDGRTYYFLDEETRKEFEKQPAKQ